MEEQEQLFSEIRQVIHQYKQEVTGKHKPWPKAVKDRVRRLRELGVSIPEISRQIGLSYATLKFWESSGKGNFKALTVKPLTVKRASKMNSTVDTLTVKTADGLEVHGLSLDQVKYLLHRGQR